MNLDSLSFALSEITYLVSNLTKKNFKSSVIEINSLVNNFGNDCVRHLFRCLFSFIDFNADSKSSTKDIHQTQLLIQEFRILLSHPNFVSLLCSAIENPLPVQKSLRPSAHLFNQISKTLKIPRVQEVVLGLGLFESNNPDIRSYARTFVKQKLPDVIRSYVDAGQEESVEDLTVEVIHLFLVHLQRDPNTLGIGPEQLSAFLATLRRDYSEDRVPAILRSLLYADCEDITTKRVTDTSLIDMLKMDLSDTVAEIGYCFTSSQEECRKALMNIGLQELTPAAVAQVLSMMASGRHISNESMSLQLLNFSASGITVGNEMKDKLDANGSNVWNVTLFVDVVQELAPRLNWKEVASELDNPLFSITNKRQLSTIVAAFSKVLQSFPVDIIYHPWKNHEGQMGFIAQALRNPDVFCFGDHPSPSVVTDVLKTTPDEESRDILTWKSLKLIEMLLYLSDHGHYQQVNELFTYPKQNCSDVLLLGLLQITTSWNQLRQELISSLIPVFLGSHPNGTAVLQYAWIQTSNSSRIRVIIIQAMADWYTADIHEQSYRLSHILDVAQELKALSMLLSVPHFSFVIDLACLASRREYLKLEKWIMDKFRDHKEIFVEALVKFLKRRAPSLFSGKEENLQDKSYQLSRDTLLTILSCMRSYLSQVSAPLAEVIQVILNNASSLLNKPIGPPPLLGQTPPSISHGILSSMTPAVLNMPPITPNLNTLPPSLSGMQQNLSAVPNPNISPAVQTSLPILGSSSSGSLSVNAYPLPPILSGASSNLGPIGLGNMGGLTANPGMSQNLGAALASNIGGFSQNFNASLSIGGVTPSLTGVTPSIGPVLPNLPTLPSKNSMDPFNNMTLMGMNPAVSSVFSHSGLSASITPSSPAKPFQLSATQANPAFGIPSLASQMHNLNLQTTLPSLMGNRNPISTPSNLLRQQSPAESLRSSSSAVGSGASIADMSTVFPEMGQQFSQEVEDEANSYFQRIYNHLPHQNQQPHQSMSTDDVIEMLKKFRSSQDKKDRDVYACMLRSLLEEYKFFPQYPEKELQITASLFGGIIEHGLVTYMALGLALRYVLEALRKPFGSKMYNFGIAALDRYKTRLKDYPQYCQHLSAIEHFHQFPQHLIAYVEYGARSEEPTPGLAQLTTSSAPPVVRSLDLRLGMQGLDTFGMSEQQMTTPSTVTTTSSVIPKTVSMTKPSIANATNIDTLLAGQPQGKEDITVPSESVQDKVFFIFNNLSQSNMTQKCEDLKENVSDENMSWVSQYLVMKRASIEPNFHTLYANFIDALHNNNFMQMVTAETFRNITVLLRSDKGVANFSDRALLKNLGHWLGMLTLAKNKPILHLNLDLKALLYEAFHKGAQELLYVVPFVAKVLESCAKSKVFRPPNPWTMGIMNVLAELHQDPYLKLNHKFEIEVLCKTLELDIRDLKPANYLKDETRMLMIEPQLSAQRKLPLSAPPVQMQHAALPPEQVTAPVVPKPVVDAPVLSSPIPNLPPQPRYRLEELASPSVLASLLVINDNILFQTSPQLKQCVCAAIERAIQELPNNGDRVIKIALATCEQIIKKDFALDPEESRMRGAAYNMVRSVTSGLTLITCRETLLTSITKNIKNALITINIPHKESIDQWAQQLAQDNIELACGFVQKVAIDKAVPEMDKRLATEYDMRKHARSDGRRYCDPAVLTYQAERMPEQIRPKVGKVTQAQLAVYEEFGSTIPGFSTSVVDTPAVPLNFNKPPTSIVAREPPPPLPIPTAPSDFIGVPGTVADDSTEIFDKIIAEIRQRIQCLVSASSQYQMPIYSLVDHVFNARNSRDVSAVLNLLQKAVEGIFENFVGPTTESELTLIFRECHLIVLKGLQEHRTYGLQWVKKHVTRCVIELPEDKRYNVDGLDYLAHSLYLNLQQYDQYLSQQLEGNMNLVLLTFSIQLIQRLCVEERPSSSITEADLVNTIDALNRVAIANRPAPEGLTKLLESLRPGGPTNMMYSGINQARQFDDPPGLHEKTEYLLREWVNMYHMPAAGKDSTKAFTTFVEQMHQQGILKSDDLITRFFRLCTEMCVDLCYRVLGEQSHNPTLVRAKCFHTLDAFVRLIALLVKHSGGTNNIITKINLLNKVLGIVAGVLLQDHEVRMTDFQQLPYHRIFIMLFIELNAPEHILESINYQVLTAFCNTYHILRPTKAPGFSYALLELISHRVFIGRMLALTPQQRGWGLYAQLLIDLFKFLSPFLRNAELSKPTQLLYKGTLRVLLVLLHDFPDFLSDFHYSFVDVIPPNCIQMRNLILSAFPRVMRLPDPFTPNLKVDMLAEIGQPPRLTTNCASLIQPATFRKDLDSYLKTRAPVTFLTDLRTNLQLNEPGMRYNIPLLNALVLYVGIQAIAHIHSKSLTPSMSTIAHSSHMDIFQNLAVDLDTEGRYLFLNAIANQLRFPNSHTHYFSCTFLYLFAEANTEAIQEQITRVLLERLIVNRPHPWGLLITFIELIKNPQYNFWDHKFVHCAPEIKKLFESVARSCVQQKQYPRDNDSDIM